MDAEERTRIAITLARAHLRSVVMSTQHTDVLINMVVADVSPGDVEDRIADILYYLEKTEPEEAEG